MDRLSTLGKARQEQEGLERVARALDAWEAEGNTDNMPSDFQEEFEARSYTPAQRRRALEVRLWGLRDAAKGIKLQCREGGLDSVAGALAEQLEIRLETLLDGIRRR